MELLEREGALAVLAQARQSAARGAGRVVFVIGEPGIGKTSLVTRFVRDLGEEARVLLGMCDDLSIPRPLGPLRDLVGDVSDRLAEALSRDASPHEIQSLVIAELELPPSPTVLVLEDVHWADEATFDSITVLGRRIRTLPALLVLTFRGGEVPPSHPLHASVGAIRAEDSVVVELAPLSERAVGILAGEQADEVYAATRGNPFYVTELLTADPAEALPPSVANAVVGRASRLDPASRRLVELVSVVPNRVSTALLDAVLPDWAAAAEEPERRQLLEVDPRQVRFRHELARNAIRSSIPVAGRRRLHAQILDALLATEADPADVVHHAEAAGAESVVAEYALVAARRAAALESNREAYSHYRRASAFLDRRPAREQAIVLEELTTVAYLLGRLDEAFPAIERAISIYSRLGDDAAVGRCTRVLSRCHWYEGDGNAARTTAREAIAILEPLGPSGELARAYSGLSQLAMNAEELEATLGWGERALELAGQLGDDATRVHALVNIGTAKLQVDREATGSLLEAHAAAAAVGEQYEATRALCNVAFSFMRWVQPREAMTWAQRALAFAQEHEVHATASYAAATIAWLRLRSGEWPEAERLAQREVERNITVAQLLTKPVLTELAVRRGDADAGERLAELAAQADRAAELQRIAPALELATEWALTTGAGMPNERLEEVLGEVRRHGALTGWGAAGVAASAAVAGLDVELDEPKSIVHAAMVRRDWARAADAFGAAGWPYDRALMLSLLDEPEALCEALDIARRLGAAPLTRHVTAQMRRLGLRVPAGPRETTRTNPAGLTRRQLEVLGLLQDGLTNAEIAERLVVSPRTAEHHVAAVLSKLGATTRRDVTQRASEFRL
jgi:DNA-binding CsgD family transcriptional regulator/tetratricopeptide (TPR) repeat protein